MNKHEINPALKKELEQLRDVPERGLQASHASRENYLAQVRSLKPRPVQSPQPARRARRRAWVPRFAAIAAVLLVALSSLGGTVYAAQASGPDDLLYGVKILSEEVQISLESDPQDRLDPLFQSFGGWSGLSDRLRHPLRPRVCDGQPGIEEDHFYFGGFGLYFPASPRLRPFGATSLGGNHWQQFHYHL